MGGIVQFDNVGLRYGTGAETLSDVSFTLAPGSFYFLTGPSGAGKTSLLKLLYLAQRPSRGLIQLFGEDIVTMPRSRMPGFRRRIGVVFQDFRLVPYLSAYDNVALPLRVAGVTEKELDGPVREMLAWVGLANRATARPATLSGGEQQRVAIARAVIGRPELLVADEPTGNVDPEMAGRLIHLFDALNKLGTTIVVATHDIHLIGRIGHAQMMRLDRGRLADPTGALLHPPQPGRHMKLGPRFAFAESRLLPDTRIAGPMPWVIAIMMFLMVLAAAGGLALGQAARIMGGDLANRATVQIVEANADLREAQAKAATTLLSRHPGVAGVRRVTDAEMAALLEPWLGGDAMAADLPVPVLIDVELRPGNAADRLAPALARVAPAARIDDHARALAPLTGVIAALKWLAAALVLLMAAATAAIVVLTARGALNTHRPTIDVMHLLGATDVQIARLFQRRIAVDALAGGLLGLAGGLAVVVALGMRLAALGSELVGSFALEPWGWALLATLPIAGMVLAMFAARWTVISALRRIL